MAERRFAALAELKKRPVSDSAETPLPPYALADTPPPVIAAAAMTEPARPANPAPQPAMAVPAGQGRGRPPGKRSDPDWKPRTILMRTKTHRRVSGILLERDDGPDLSELIDEVLTSWISKQA
jgi:hypothetical protein